MSDVIVTTIDYNAGPADFIKQVRAMIQLSRDNDKCVPLPIILQTGEAFLGQISLFLAAVNCRECSALCCRQAMEKGDLGISLIEEERQFFLANECHLVKRPDAWYHSFPCHFHNPAFKGANCLIYSNRPLACILFPFQPGGAIGEEKIPSISVNVHCPEGERLALQIYQSVYNIRSKITSFDSEMRGPDSRLH